LGPPNPSKRCNAGPLEAPAHPTPRDPVGGWKIAGRSGVLHRKALPAPFETSHVTRNGCDGVAQKKIINYRYH
ncbi:MAG TPA: hypothetical protein VG963_04715, partial [Polyangiaceae bacterium]|nr:hypothetical protein [Polyangiaceae bacterium]